MALNSGWWHAPDPAVETYRAAEATRRRLGYLGVILSLLLVVLCFFMVPVIITPTAPLYLNVASIVGIGVLVACIYVPFSALMLPLALAGTGIRVRYVSLWLVALVREDRHWRIARLRRQSLEQIVMPTLDTVDLRIQHENALAWAACLGMLVRSVVMFCLAWVFGALLRDTTLAASVGIVFGMCALGSAVIDALVIGLHQLLTRGLERPAFTEQRRITLRSRAAISAGARPRDIPQHDIDTMAAWGDAFPELDIVTAPHWARARLTAAACLVDRGDLDTAIDLLESVAASKQRVLVVMVFEARFALAYCLALQGLSMSTARGHYRSSRPRFAYPYERAAIKCLFHVHANEPTAARRDAERALRLSRRPLSIGDANAVREQMQALLARLDAART